ncbi:response regulator [Mucilaginibacter sp. CAU 1740]|uniref:response regulator n=1 Tax=Mucilaginibacter sp. CAU 1740 TaxID=3140365 RepID=UPI00325A7168
MNYSNPTSVFSVDDEMINNFITKSMFSKYYPATNVTTFLSAQDAIDYLHQLTIEHRPHPEYLFLDLNMKGMDGWEFLKIYHERGFTKMGTRVVILTSSVFKKDIEMAKSIDFVHEIISKPLTYEHIEMVMKI